MKSRIYIVGKSRLGRAIKAELPEAKLISRSDGIAYTEKTLTPILKDANVVILAAGKTRGSEAELMREHVKTAEAVARAVPKNATLLYASSISVYGKKRGPIKGGESLPLKPDTAYAKAKAEAEKALRTARRVRARDKTIIFRIGTMYGIEYESYVKMFKAIEKGLVPVIGAGKNNVPFTYIRDVAKAFAAATKQLIKGRGLAYDVYNLAGSGCQQEAAIDLAAQYLGAKPRKIHVPLFLAKGMGKLCNAINDVGKSGCPWDEEAVLSLSSDRHISSERAKKAALFKETPIQKGIEAVVKAYKAQTIGKKPKQ